MTVEERVEAVVRTYNSWHCMKGRCTHPNNPRWKDYGGRGITVCDRWLGREGCATFVADMGLRPKGTTIDRIDPDGSYESGNCRWATPKQQAANKRPRRKRYGSTVVTRDGSEGQETVPGPRAETVDLSAVRAARQ